MFPGIEERGFLKSNLAFQALHAALKEGHQVVIVDMEISKEEVQATIDKWLKREP